MARKPNAERVRIDLWMEPELAARIEKMRVVWSENVSQYIRRAIIERVQRDEASLPPPKGGHK